MPFSDSVFGNPVIHESSFVDRAATLIGRVIIDELVLVAPNASLRADEEGPFRVCRGSNIQDNVIFHGHKNRFVQGSDNLQYSIFVDEETTIAHRSLLHGPLRVGKKTFIGANTTIWSSQVGDGCFIRNGARVEDAIIGNNCLIGVNAVVIDVELPDNTFVCHGAVVCNEDDLNDPKKVKVVKTAKIDQCRSKNTDIVVINHELVQKYKERAKLMLEQERRERLEKQKRHLDLIRESASFKDNPQLLELGEELLKILDAA